MQKQSGDINDAILNFNTSSCIKQLNHMKAKKDVNKYHLIVSKTTNMFKKMKITLLFLFLFVFGSWAE